VSANWLPTLARLFFFRFPSDETCTFTGRDPDDRWRPR